MSFILRMATRIGLREIGNNPAVADLRGFETLPVSKENPVTRCISPAGHGVYAFKLGWRGSGEW
jgi:hypothetical protein